MRANPENLAATVGLAEGYRQLQKPEAAAPLLDKALNDPKLDANTALSVAQTYAAVGNVTKLETALEKLAKLMPTSPESWYDLAVLKARIGKPAEALLALHQALDLSAKRLQRDPKARDLLASARKEESFGTLRGSPEFKKMVPP